jgi:hypothetical protein
MSDMAADGIIRTGLKRCIHRHLKHPDQRPLRPPKLLFTKSAIYPAAKVGQAADGLIETTMTICIYRHLIHLDQRPLFDTYPPFPADRSNRAAAVRYCGVYNTVILSRGRLYVTYTLTMVQKKIIYRLIRSK